MVIEGTSTSAFPCAGALRERASNWLRRLQCQFHPTDLWTTEAPWPEHRRFVPLTPGLAPTQSLFHLTGQVQNHSRPNPLPASEAALVVILASFDVGLASHFSTSPQPAQRKRSLPLLLFPRPAKSCRNSVVQIAAIGPVRPCNSDGWWSCFRRLSPSPRCRLVAGREDRRGMQLRGTLASVQGACA